MKKGVVALLIIVALIVLVSPGIVGQLAERSVDNQLEFATSESDDVVIRSAKFDRGWFSSAGQYRIEFRDTPNTAGLKTLLGMSASDGLPVLVIDTHLDHGLFPLTSITREQGSLAPGLGSAVSRVSIESADGEVFELPGAIYSTIGLGGELLSNYKIEPGENEDARWGAVDINFALAASSGDVGYDGSIESLTLTDGDQALELRALTFEGAMAQTEFGFGVGDANVRLESVTVGDVQAGGFSLGPATFESTSSVDDARFNTVAALDMNIANVPGYGEVSARASGELRGADAAALGRVIAAADALPADTDPTMAMMYAEKELMDLVAAGFTLDISNAEITLPDGTIRSALRFDVEETDRDDFAWTSLLLALDAAANLELPESIAAMAMLMSPQAGMLEGFLVKKGDVYVVDVAYKQGVLTVNGAPMAVPLQ